MAILEAVINTPVAAAGDGLSALLVGLLGWVLRQHFRSDERQRDVDKEIGEAMRKSAETNRAMMKYLKEHK